MKAIPQLVFCDDACVMRGKSYQGLPLLIDSNEQVVWSVSDYLRKRMCNEDLDHKTIQHYAHWLRQWWEFMDREDVAWDRVNDALLEQYRNEQDADPKVSGHTCTEKLRTIYLFYWWAQQNGYVDRIIGQVDRERGIPPFPISIGAQKQKGRNSGSGDLSIAVKFPIRSRFKKQKKAISLANDKTLDAHYSDIIHGEESNSPFAQYIAIRDALIFDWMDQVGLRRMEVASLIISALPTQNVVDKNDDDEQVSLVSVIGKFKKKRLAEVSPELIRRTRYFIEQERDEFVSEKRKRGALATSDYVFLSTTTGERLSAKSITNTFLDRAKRIGACLHPHMLRHVALTRRTEFAIAEQDKHAECKGAIFSIETAMLQIAESSGWNDVAGMAKTYVHLAQRKNRAELDADKSFWDSTAVENLRRENEILKRQLQRKKDRKK